VTHGHVPDGVFDNVRLQFSETEIVDLTMAVVAINSWTRIAISVRATPQVESANIAA
jgi:alkylhydroperoxidase family enzyme